MLALLLITAVVLSQPLADWKAEIEKRDGGKVILVRIATENGAMILPEDTDARPVLRRFFLNEAFREQLSRAHALTVNWDGIEGKYHFIVLNMALADQWKGAEDAVLAHEFGHIWLDAAGYRSLPYEPGPNSCLATHASDAVQHILIRREMERRGIPQDPYWLPNLEKALAEMEKGASQPASYCQALARLGLWVDVRLGLTEERWEKLPRFLELMGKNYPELGQYADELVEYLEGLDVTDFENYRAALKFSAAAFERTGAEIKNLSRR